MKNLIITLGITIVILSGCKSIKEISRSEIYAIDSTSVVYENVNNLGTFIYVKDTVKMWAINQQIIDKKTGVSTFKIKYKVINK